MVLKCYELCHEIRKKILDHALRIIERFGVSTNDGIIDTEFRLSEMHLNVIEYFDQSRCSSIGAGV
jgi:hypothetical protein